MVLNIELDIADDQGEEELDKESVKHYHAIVGSPMYPALISQPDLSYAIAALCRYNSRCGGKIRFSPPPLLSLAED